MVGVMKSMILVKEENPVPGIVSLPKPAIRVDAEAEAEADADPGTNTEVKVHSFIKQEDSDTHQGVNTDTREVECDHSTGTSAINITNTQGDQSPPQQIDSCLSVLLDEDYSGELEKRLGRANGNVFYRKPGVPNMHDGQIMVRLKKKRYIVIDYSIIPTSLDIAAASVSPNISCPNGAGKQLCVSPECSKVGVPVLLYDSNPDQPSSLYLRSGLCFSCQRALNEKRRTQRKRKGDTLSKSQTGKVTNHNLAQISVDQNSQVMEPTTKRSRLNGEILDLNPDAIIINGPLVGTKHHGPGYDYKDIVMDLKSITIDSSQQANQLKITVDSISGTGLSSMNSVENSIILSMYEKIFHSMSKGIFLLSQWKSSWDSAIVALDSQKTPVNNSLLDSSTIADVVASAAAVAAAQTIPIVEDKDLPEVDSKDGNVTEQDNDLPLSEVSPESEVFGV